MRPLSALYSSRIHYCNLTLRIRIYEVVLRSQRSRTNVQRRLGQGKPSTYVSRAQSEPSDNTNRDPQQPRPSLVSAGAYRAPLGFSFLPTHHPSPTVRARCFAGKRHRHLPLRALLGTFGEDAGSAGSGTAHAEANRSAEAEKHQLPLSGRGGREGVDWLREGGGDVSCAEGWDERVGGLRRLGGVDWGE